MATASTSSRSYVRGLAVAAAGVALTTDVGLDERPTHSVVLGLVAVVVWVIHRRLSRGRDRATSGAAVPQPLPRRSRLFSVSSTSLLWQIDRRRPAHLMVECFPFPVWRVWHR
jgi:hypothetical protein